MNGRADIEDERRDLVTRWVACVIAAADSDVTLFRLNHGQITMELPEGSVFTVTIEEIE